MTIPLQLIILSLPSIIYVVIGGWRHKRWRVACGDVGWRSSHSSYFLWGLGIMILIGGLGWIAFQFVPAEILRDPRINIPEYSGLKPDFEILFVVLLKEAINIALGEEIFFRGFLGG